MLILDTHTLLWVLLEPQNLKTPSRNRIEKAQKNHQLIMPVVVLWEIAMLISKKRISTLIPIKQFLDNIVALPGLNVAELTTDIVAESVSLPGEFHGDPFDRMIVATARCLNGDLMTRDASILKWAKHGYLKTYIA